MFESLLEMAHKMNAYVILISEGVPLPLEIGYESWLGNSMNFHFSRGIDSLDTALLSARSHIEFRSKVR